MEQVNLRAEPRQRQAKGHNGRLRRAGRVPAVVYGGGKPERMISVEAHALELILRGARQSNAIFNLELSGGDREQVMIREMQRHPVHGRFVHIDFLRVDLTRTVDVDVALHVVGDTPAGVRMGGILEHLHRTVRVRALPMNVPGRLDVDLTELKLNETFHVRDLKLPAGVQVLDAPDLPLFTILPPRVEAEPAPAEQVMAEPEVVTEKKKEEDEEEDEEK